MTITFVRETRYPRLAPNWPACARAARQLLEQRQERYPALIEAGRLDPAEAARGLAVMGAVAALWNLIDAQEPLPAPLDFAAELGASWPAMLAELARAAARTAEIAAAAPDDQTKREQTELAIALHWHMQPVADGAALPHIWVAHDHALYVRDHLRRDAAA